MADLRPIAAPFVALGPSGVAVRTRLGDLTPADEKVLRLVGAHLGSLASKDLKARCADGLEHSTESWAARKRDLTAESSSRWAGSITKATHDQWALARRGQAAHVQSLEAGITTIRHRLSLPVGQKGTKRTPGGYRSAHEWFNKARRLHVLEDRLDRVRADRDAGRVHVVRGGKRLLGTRNNLHKAQLTEAEWRERWEAGRWFLHADGESGKRFGNETIRITPEGEVSIKLPARLSDLANAKHAGAWYNHTIEFQAKGKAVEDVVQLSGAPGEREMCTTKSGVRSGADFKGKTLGVTDLGSGTDTLTQFLAAKKGVKAGQFHRIGVGAGSTAIAALQNGKVDCVMTTQPTVAAIQKKGVGTSAIDLATTSGATAAMGGAYPAASVLARTDWVNSHKATVQKVVDALVATMHWINTHSAADIANKLPASYVSNQLVTKADYIAALTEDKGQFLPDGLMPAGGPKTVLATEQLVGNVKSSVDLSKTFTNDFAIQANKTEGFKTTTTPAGSNG